MGFVLLVLGLRAMREPREAELQQWSPAFLCPFMNYKLGSKRAMVEAELVYSFVIKINNLK